MTTECGTINHDQALARDVVSLLTRVGEDIELTVTRINQGSAPSRFMAVLSKPKLTISISFGPSILEIANRQIEQGLQEPTSPGQEAGFASAKALLAEFTAGLS